MPANLTPQYLKVEAEFRRAQSPEEELRCLELMLREIPKHKGTDKLQAELKAKISKAITDLYGATNMVIREMELADRAKQESRKMLTEIAQQLEDARKAIQKSKKPDLQIIAQQEFEKIKIIFEDKDRQTILKKLKKVRF